MRQKKDEVILDDADDKIKWCRSASYDVAQPILK